MVKKYLGEEIDIHGGGKDLIFPHHTNEIAQTMAAYGTKLARYWVHNGFVNVKGEKMSKSLKNFYTVSEVLEKFDASVLRFFLSSINYRSPINFSFEALERAKTNLERIKNAYYQVKSLQQKRIMKGLKQGPETEDKGNKTGRLPDELNEIRQKFIEAMNDDLNVSDALSQVYRAVKFANANIIMQPDKADPALIHGFIEFMEDFFRIFGLALYFDVDDFTSVTASSGAVNSALNQKLRKFKTLTQRLIDLIVDVRSELRKRKLYELSDKIRENLADLGITLSDMKDKTMWKFEG